MFTQLKLCLATVTHYFKGVKISLVCLVLDQIFANLLNNHLMIFYSIQFILMIIHPLDDLSYSFRK